MINIACEVPKKLLSEKHLDCILSMRFSCYTLSFNEDGTFTHGHFPLAACSRCRRLFKPNAAPAHPHRALSVNFPRFSLFDAPRSLHVLMLASRTLLRTASASSGAVVARFSSGASASSPSSAERPSIKSMFVTVGGAIASRIIFGHRRFLSGLRWRHRANFEGAVLAAQRAAEAR